MIVFSFNYRVCPVPMNTVFCVLFAILWVAIPGFLLITTISLVEIIINTNGTICHSDRSRTSCGCWSDSKITIGIETYVYYLWKPPKISSPWGMFLSDTAHVGEYSRKAKPSRYDISHEPSEYFLTRIHEFFHRSEPSSLTSQLVCLVKIQHTTAIGESQ